MELTFKIQQYFENRNARVIQYIHCKNAQYRVKRLLSFYNVKRRCFILPEKRNIYFSCIRMIKKKDFSVIKMCSCRNWLILIRIQLMRAFCLCTYVYESFELNLQMKAGTKKNTRPHQIQIPDELKNSMPAINTQFYYICSRWTLRHNSKCMNHKMILKTFVSSDNWNLRQTKTVKFTRVDVIISWTYQHVVAEPIW